jgi:hypothetical protein
VRACHAGLPKCQGARLAELHAVTEAEVEGLYKRFRALDRGRKGYISGDEFLQIPELSINPIAQVCTQPPRTHSLHMHLASAPSSSLPAESCARV